MKKAVSLILTLLMVLCFISAASAAATVEISGTHDITVYRIENDAIDYSTVLASKKKTDVPAALSIVAPYDELGLSQGGKFEEEAALVAVQVTMNGDFSADGAKVMVNGGDPTLVTADQMVFFASLSEEGGISSYEIYAEKPYADSEEGSGVVRERFSLYIDYMNNKMTDKTLNIVDVENPEGADYAAYMVAGRLYIDFEGEAHSADVRFTFADENRSEFSQITYVAASSGSSTAEQRLDASKATFRIEDEELKFTGETAGSLYTSAEIPVVFRSNIPSSDPKGVNFVDRVQNIKIGQTITPAVEALDDVEFTYTLEYADGASSIMSIDGKSVIGLKEGVGYVTLNCTAGGKIYTDTMKVIVSDEIYLEPTPAYVTGASVNVRSGAGASHPRIGSVHRGDKVGVLSVHDGWAMISYDGGTAYVSAKYLTDETMTPEAYYVTCRALNVRRGAGTQYAKTGLLHRGDEVEVLSISGSWAKIAYEDGTAYVSASELSKRDSATETS